MDMRDSKPGALELSRGEPQNWNSEADTVMAAAARLDPVHERRRRHGLELLSVCVAGLVPWTVVLGLTLPTGRSIHSWRLTWVGFDVMLIVAMACTAFFGLRRHRAVLASALATAVLLICDAWFDVSLDIGTPDIWMSVGLAVFAELPMAAFLIHRVNLLMPLILAPAPPWRVMSEKVSASTRSSSGAPRTPRPRRVYGRSRRSVV